MSRKLLAGAVVGILALTPTVASAAGSDTPPSADIAVTAGPNHVLVPQGTWVTSTATVTNLGPDAAQKVVLNTTGGLLGGATASQGVSVSCADSSGIMTCTIPSLPLGGWATISVRHYVRYFSHQFGQGAEAWATSATSDPNPNNNVAYASWYRNCSPQC